MMESRPPRKFPNYMMLMSSIIDVEPSSFEEETNQQVWWDAMVEEYASILRNDVWDIMSRPQGKSIVSSRWLYKIKYVADGSIQKFKVRFVARGFSPKEREWTTRKHLLKSPGMLLFKLLLLFLQL
jgi:hypothetical protein